MDLRPTYAFEQNADPTATFTTETEKAILDWCNQAHEEGKFNLEQSEEVKRVEQYINYLMGRQWPTKRPAFKASPVDNRLWKILIAYISNLTDVKPTWDITTGNKAYLRQAEILKQLSENWWLTQNVDIALGHVIVFAMLTTGYGMLKWNPALCGGKGDMEMRAVGPTDVLPLRPQGLDIQGCEGVIYRTVKPLNFFRSKYGIQGWRVKPDPAYAMGSRAAMRPPWVMAGVWELMSPGMKRIIGVRPDMVQSVFPVAEYREYWVKDETVNDSGRNVYMGTPTLKNAMYMVPPGGKLYPRGRLIITAGNDVLLFDGPNPFWHGRFPFEKLCMNNVPWQWHGPCYSSDTEVLTKRGWLKFADATIDDEFATRSKDRRFEWQKASLVTNLPYVGPMYRFHSKAVDLLVTPNHRMLVSPVPKVIGGWNNSGPKTAKGRKQHHEGMITATELAFYGNPMTAIPQTSTWTGREIMKREFSCGRTADKPILMTGDDYCEFMGAYLSEGWTNKRAGGKKSDARSVFITQFKKSKGYEPYRKLLDRIMGTPVAYDGKNFVISRSGLARFCKQFGRSWEKYIPSDIMEASPRQLKIFWNSFVLGDGSVKARPISKRIIRDGEECIQRLSTVSKKLSDQLVEVAQKMGWSASSKEYRAKEAISEDGRVCKRRAKYEIVLRYSRYMRIRTDEEQYNGRVHCVTVPNGTLYVRRNGKPSWCGNSEFRVQLPLQDTVNQVFAGVLDIVKKAVNPVLIAPEMAFSDSVRRTMDQSMPGAQLFYNPNLSPVPPQLAPPPTLPGYVMDLMVWAMREMDAHSGLLDLQAISRMGQIPAADTLEQLKEGQQTVIRLKGRHIEEFLRNVGTQAISNFFQFYTMDRRIRILGEDGISFQDLDFDPMNLIPSGQDPQLFSQSFAFQVKPGSSLNSSRAQRAMIMNALRRQGDMDRRSLLEALGFGSMADMIEKNLREEGKDLLINLVKGKMGGKGGGTVEAAQILSAMQGKELGGAPPAM